MLHLTEVETNISAADVWLALCRGSVTSGSVRSRLFGRCSSCRLDARPGSSHTLAGTVSKLHDDRSSVPPAPSGRSKANTTSSPLASVSLCTHIQKVGIHTPTKLRAPVTWLLVAHYPPLPSGVHCAALHSALECEDSMQQRVAPCKRLLQRVALDRQLAQAPQVAEPGGEVRDVVFAEVQACELGLLLQVCWHL